MAMLQVYTKCLQIYYKSNIISKASFLVVLLSFLSIYLPFLLGYKTGGFWLKRDVFNEFPNVKFKGEYLLTVLTENIHQPIWCHNLPFRVKLHKNFLDCSNIKVQELDNNKDTLVDEFSLSINIYLPKEVKPVFFTLIVPIDYTLKGICPLHMESGIIVQQYIMPSTTAINLYGTLQIQQSSPLYCNRHIVNNIYNVSLFSSYDSHGAELSNIINDYYNRNLSTHVTSIYTTFNMENRNELQLNIKIKYVEQIFYYKPTFWHIIKWAWIQYYAIYIIVYALFDKVKLYIFNNRLVLFYEENPFKIKRY